ncbi:MAG TPA: protease inhibitor I42 family protein [Methanocorpusculum sp.]|nr:protease inhibitor I42 family protein [Methanocorpusculum sp.]
MKKVIPVIIAAAVLFGCIFVAGCVEEQKPAAPVEVGEPAYSVLVTLDGMDTYSTGDIFSLEFVSNPTTGYQWIVTEGNEILYNNFTTAPKQNDDGLIMAGAPGKQTFWFQPEKAGDYTITLKYMRSWEGEDSAVSTYSQKIHVVDSNEPSPNGAKTQYVFDSFNINPAAGEFAKVIKTANPTTGYYWTASGDGLTIIEDYKVANPELMGSPGQYEWYATAAKAGDYVFRAEYKRAGSDEVLSYFEIPMKFV